jgi:O-antigen ligase
MSRWINVLWFCLLFSLILYPLIIYGGVLPNEIFFIETISALILILSLIQNLIENNKNSIIIKPKFLCCLILLLILTIAQIIPLPLKIISFLSPSTITLKNLSQNPLLIKLTNNALALDNLSKFCTPTDSFNCLSIYPYASYFKLLFLIALTMLFFAIVKKNLSKVQIRVILLFIIISGLIQSFIYLLSYLQAKPIVISFYNYKPQKIAGTFVNRDHFAAYMNMTIPVIASWIAFHLHQSTKSAFSSMSRSLNILTYKSGSLTLSIIFFSLMTISSFFSLSRAGIVSCLLAFAFLFFIKAKSSGKLQLSTLIIIIILIILSLIYWIGYIPILQRFKAVPADFESTAGRFAVWKNSIRIIKDFPILGIGIGNTAYVFTKYKSFSNTHYSYLHNDYLQFTVEHGLIAALILFVIIFLFYNQILQFPWINNSRSQFLAFGMLAAITSVALHSFFDFPLQTPANAVLFTIYIALLFSLMNINAFERIQDIKRKKEFPFF